MFPDADDEGGEDEGVDDEGVDDWSLLEAELASLLDAALATLM